MGSLFILCNPVYAPTIQAILPSFNSTGETLAPGVFTRRRSEKGSIEVRSMHLAAGFGLVCGAEHILRSQYHAESCQPILYWADAETRERMPVPAR